MIDATYYVPRQTNTFDLQEFINYVKTQHKGQQRRNGTDYFQHCQNVSIQAEEIAKELELDDNKIKTIKAAAYGHDLYEDTRTDYEDVVKRTNDEVASIISWVSDDKRIPSQHRHEHYMIRLSSAPLHAQIVKLADIVDNSHDSFELISSENKRFLNRWCTREIITLRRLRQVSDTKAYITAQKYLEKLSSAILKIDEQ